MYQLFPFEVFVCKIVMLSMLRNLTMLKGVKRYAWHRKNTDTVPWDNHRENNEACIDISAILVVRVVIPTVESSKYVLHHRYPF